MIKFIIIFFAFILPPIGIFFVFKSKYFSKTGKIIASIWLGVFILAIIVEDGEKNVSTNQSNKSTQASQSADERTNNNGNSEESTLHNIISSDDKKAGNDKKIEVYIEPEFTINNGKLVISGNTNLIDDTIITYWIRVKNLEDKLWEMEKDIHKRHELRVASQTSGDILVEDKSFKKGIDISGFIDGNILVELYFSHLGQPENVTKKYGELNKYIKGDNVIKRKTGSDEDKYFRILSKEFELTIK